MPSDFPVFMPAGPSNLHSFSTLVRGGLPITLITFSYYSVWATNTLSTRATNHSDLVQEKST
jgi:hypothetical protein